MILVAGGGPGGLSAALALQRAGLEVTVWERAAQLRTAGAGLSLQINAMRMLAALGVADEVRARGAELRRGSLSDLRGRTLQSIPLERLAARYGQPGVGIMRGALSETLVAALRDGTVEHGRAVAVVQRDEEGVSVVDGAGESARFDAVVAADGIHSATRTAVFGETALRYAGYTCWRGVADVPTPDGGGHMHERWGPGVRFGTVPVAASRTYWFATATAPEGLEDGPDPKTELVERFAGFPSAVREVLAATDAEAILRNDIIDFPPLRSWTRGRVTLLGDAAHAMTPNLGQGACQAIEDAVVLAAALRRDGVPAGFASYEACRRPRAATFVNRSFRMGAIGQTRNAALRWFRDRLLPLVASEAMVERQLGSIYGVDVPPLTG